MALTNSAGGGVDQFRNNMLRMFDDFERDLWGPYALAPLAPGAALSTHAHRNQPMSIDVAEAENEFRVLADLPGVNKDDIHIDVDGNVLSVSAERKREEEETTDKFHRVERSCGKVHRSVRLPDTADLENVSASYNDGVLRITVPKTEPKSSRRIAVA
jgi:HSP20 family protein